MSEFLPGNTQPQPLPRKPAYVREPVSMTLADVLALVAGVAVSFAVVSSLPPLPLVRLPLEQMVLGAIRLLQGVCLTLSAVVLSRVVVYSRMPTPAEWLAILVGDSLLAERTEFRVDSWINGILTVFGFPDDLLSFIQWRWLVAGLFSAGIMAAFGLLGLGRVRFAGWFKTVLLAWVALLAMAGPLWVFGQHGPDLISPSLGFGAGLFATLYRSACWLAAGLPMGLLFGFAATASLYDRALGRWWSWTDWASLSGSAMTGFAATMLYQGEFAIATPGWFLERLLVLIWFLAIMLISRWILIRFEPGWRLWLSGSSA